ncbi:MAG: SET domain-containing protein-lysine N-methyltransferase [Aquabacterium sp.]|uniref:SET domain-containing protein n=1 Tax=Aquabacterium sp. TaxID=1872578 RepID=UPI002719BD63|nr:SET domain-containing protein-lysine N-methyltransferase [Aquabacterium sp.]MDO9003321.1 SET domain-containing protein-lysine N-methyltransferase [Aquabacterium sp.]
MPTLRPLPAAPDPQREKAPATAKGQVADPQKIPVDIKPSAIDGQGVFALQAVPARRKIGEIRGESVSTAEAFKRAKALEKSTGRVFMIAVSNARSLDATQSTDPLRFANHSCAPNMVLKVQQGRVAFYALRDIAAGEELTVAYGPTHHAGRLACRCGAPGCAGRL